MGLIAILNEKGHTAVTWDEAKPATIEKARMTYQEFLDQGFVTFKAVAGGPAEQIREFDQTAERILVLRPFVGG